jgi:serine protease Do
LTPVARAAEMPGTMLNPPSLAPLLLAGALLAAPPPARAETQPFRVLNRTGQQATEMNAVRNPRGAANDWGRNLLTRPLAPEAGFSLRPSESAGCRFDIRLLLADGRVARAEGQDICANPVVALGPGNVMAAGGTAKPAAPATAVPPAGFSPGGPSAQFNPQARVASGTGFVVARDRVLTNRHVIDGCNRVLVRTADGRTLAATPPARVDAERDLALLAVPGDPGPVLTFRRDPAVRRGEAVVTYGFPLAGLLSSGPTLTTGEVSALAGLADNQVQFQISAPVQPGNSGGPLFDRQGHLVGVIVSKLNAARVAQRTGDIPQNVNFAVKGTEATEFLRRAGVTPQMADSRGPDRSAAEVGELAHRSTLFVRCER